MNSLVLINEKDNLRAYYYLKEVERISYGKMKDFRNEKDILANGHKKNESAIQILFTDDSVATYGEKWHIEFRAF